MADGNANGNGSTKGGANANPFAELFPENDDDETQSARADFRRRYVPESCDLFTEVYDAQKHAELEANGRDPVGCRIKLYRHTNGRRSSIAGIWPVEQTSIGWLTSHFGPGSYDVQLLDRHNRYVMQQHHDLDAGSVHGYPPPPYPFPGAPHVHPGYPFNPSGAPPAHNAPFPHPHPPPWYPPQPPPPPMDPMRDAVASFAKLLGVQMQMEEMRLKRQQHYDAPSDRREGREHEITLLLLKNAIADKGKKNGGGDVPQSLESLRFGIALGERLSKKNPDDDDIEWIKEAVPSAIQHLGPGLIATIANAALPPEKAEAVLNIIEQSQKNAAEEAKARAKETPIDTDGAEVA